jgi:hypothetical protein
MSGSLSGITLLGKGTTLGFLGALASASLGFAAAAPCTNPDVTCVPVTWDPARTEAMSTTLYKAPPVTPTTLAGVDFSMRDAVIHLTPNQSSTVSGLRVQNASAAHLLLTGAYVSAGTNATPAGTVTLTFSDATTISTAIVVGKNLRDWKVGQGGAVVTTITGATEAWRGLSLDNVAAVIDMTSIAIPAGKADLVSVTVADTSTVGVHILWSGLTLIDPPPAPAPTPIPTPPPAVEPGHGPADLDEDDEDDEHEASQAQAAEHAKSVAEAAERAKSLAQAAERAKSLAQAAEHAKPQPKVGETVKTVSDGEADQD